MSSTMVLWSRLARASASSPERTFYWGTNGHEYCDCNLQASFESTKVKTGFSLVLPWGSVPVWSELFISYEHLIRTLNMSFIIKSRSINTCKADLTADSNVQGTDHKTPYNLHSSLSSH